MMQEPKKGIRNHKQQLTQALVMTLEKLSIDQQVCFISGFICPRLGLMPEIKNVTLLQKLLYGAAAYVQDGLISFTNFIETVVEASTIPGGNVGDVPSQQVCKKFEDKAQALCGELACSRKYLREKWFKQARQQSVVIDSGGKIQQGSMIQDESMKLIQQLQQQDKRQQENRRKQLQKQSQKYLSQLLKQQQQKQKQRKQKMMQVQKQNMTCQICVQQIPYTDVGTLSCGHMFHKGCIRGHIEALVMSKKLDIPCPTACGKNLPLEDIQEYIDGDLKEKFEKFCFDVYVEKNDKFVSWCPTPGCTAVFTHEGDLDNYRCPVCKKHYCLSCRCEYHRGQTCAEYRITHSYGQDDKKFEQFVRGAKFKQCPKCKFWVQRIEGCSTMACRCGHQFCYDCGGSDCPHGMCKNNPGGGGGIIGGIIRRPGRRR